MQIDITTALLVFPWAFFGGLELGRWMARRTDRAAGVRLDTAARTPWMPAGGFISDPNLMRQFEVRMEDSQPVPDGPESEAEGL